MITQSKRIHLLDGARGIAAISIVFFHLYSTKNSYIASLWIFVDFFFVLSGFVLSSSIRNIGNRGNLKIFLWNRAVRLIPMAYTALFVILGIQLLVNLKYLIYEEKMPEGIPMDLFTLIIAFTFMQVFSVKAQLLLYPLWSLSVEWITNVIAAMAVKKRKIREILVFIAPGLTLLAFYYVGNDSAWVQSVANQLGRGMYAFGVGLLLARYSSKLPQVNQYIAGLIAIGSVCATVQLASSLGDLSSLFAPILFGTSIYYLNSIDEKRLRNFVLDACNYLGRTSYGIYVWHVVAANLVGLFIENGFVSDKALEEFFGGPKLLLVFGMTLILTEFTLRYIEIPFRRKFKRG